MRRPLSLVVLLGLWWSQGVALQCPVAVRSDQGPVEAFVDRGSESATPTAMAMAADPDMHAMTRHAAHPHSDGAACHIVMTCAWAMIDAARTYAALELAAPAHRYAVSIRAPHATADLLADPPPPRLDA